MRYLAIVSALTMGLFVGGPLLAVHWIALLFAVLLTFIGIATIRSATAELATDYAVRQGLWLLIGVVACLLALAIDYRFLVRFAWPLYGLSLVALLLVLLFGHEAGGARSWVGVAGLGVQPSELAKLATVLILARRLGDADGATLTLRDLTLSVAVTVPPVFLIVAQRDLGSAAMFFPMFAAMIFVAGLKRKTVLALLVGAVITLPLAWNYGLQDYQRQRVLSFLAQQEDPLGAGYQLQQSRIAVGSGELSGRGYMQGTQSQLRFLPARHTDFVVAVLAEEWGFLGIAAVMGLYAALFSALSLVASRAADRTGLLLVVGLVTVQAAHVLYNTAMVIGWLPITGIPLPYLSYGGSFLLASFLSLGVMLGVDFRRHANF